VKEPRSHPGITYHKMTVGGNLPGFIFAIGCMSVLLLAFPGLFGPFLLSSIAIGVAIAILFRLLRSKSDVHPIEHL